MLDIITKHKHFILFLSACDGNYRKTIDFLKELNSVKIPDNFNSVIKEIEQYAVSESRQL